MEMQQHAISQKHQSPRERDDRLGTQAAEMGPEGIPDSKAWAFLNSKANFKTPGRSAEKIEKAVAENKGDLAIVWLTKNGEEYLKNMGART